MDRYEAEDIYYDLAEVLDPERPGCTLGSLKVVNKDRVWAKYNSAGTKAYVVVELSPTVPHCSFMTLIALCVRAKLLVCLPVNVRWKIDIRVAKGSHLQAEEIERQVNDKERVAAALENPTLAREVQKLIDPYSDEV